MSLDSFEIEADQELDETNYLQINTDRIVETKKTFKGWDPKWNGFPGTINEHGEYIEPYNRKVPEVFIGDAADEKFNFVDKFT